MCSALLKRFRSKDDFLLRLVTKDETKLIHAVQSNLLERYTIFFKEAVRGNIT